MSTETPVSTLSALNPAVLALADKTVSTKHKLKIGKTTLNYTADCGTVVLKEEWEKSGEAQAEKKRAQLFFVAYTVENKSETPRPITFSFNGGPGSSSVWLHMGFAGPQRIFMEGKGDAGAPPYKLVDNIHTMLTETDLVFIDPVGTGFSRMVEGEKVGEYHNYQRDLESVGEFIRLYVSRNKRWNSRKYLIGESYGTTRAAGLSSYLQEKFGMYINGVMLISCALEFSHLRFDNGNDLPPVLYLPTYAATAWYHGKLSADLQKRSLRSVLDEVEAYASSIYAAALFQGRALPAAAETEVVKQLARYTGLSATYIRATRLRINIAKFVKELLRSEGKTVGRLDSRFTGLDRDNSGETFETDPSYTAILGPYASTFNHYVRATLNYENDLPYHTLSGLYLTWGWNEFTNKYVSVSESLRKAMAANPDLKVFVGNGYYDFATPHFASDYCFNQLAVDETRAKNITVRYYEAGHMMYVHQPSLKALADDVRAFLKSA